MRNLFGFLLISTACLIGTLISPRDSFSQDTPLAVAVSIPPQKYFAERIGGKYVSVTVMIPPGADPHIYEPRPRQIVALADAEIYFAIGVPFEAAWLPRFRSVNPKLNIVRTDEGIRKIPMISNEPTGSLHNDSHEGGLDTHIWLSPALVRKIAETMHLSLASADPAHADEYHLNYEKFLNEIDALEKYLRTLFPSGIAPGKFMVFHPAWGYFAQACNLIQIPVEVEGKELKPSEIVRLVRLARSENITVIFVQPQFSTRSAKTISDAIGGELVFADPLAEDWNNNLRTVAKKFKSALR